MGRRATLAQQAAHRELAALVDGPCAPRWYWRDDLEGMQTASRRMGNADHHPAAVLCCYQPTEQWVEHPHEPDTSGRVWRYHQPPARQ